MNDIKKIQWKIVYIKSSNGPKTWKNSNSLNVGYRENSMKNCVHKMQRNSKFKEKFEFVKCKI